MSYTIQKCVVHNLAPLLRVFMQSLCPNHTLKSNFVYLVRCMIDRFRIIISRSSLFRVSNEISTDMNNRTHYNSDWERYRLFYITRK